MKSYTRKELENLRDRHGYAMEREPGTWEVLTMDAATGGTVLLMVREEESPTCEICDGPTIFHVMTNGTYCETCNDWTF